MRDRMLASCSIAGLLICVKKLKIRDLGMRQERSKFLDLRKSVVASKFETSKLTADQRFTLRALNETIACFRLGGKSECKYEHARLSIV